MKLINKFLTFLEKKFPSKLCESNFTYLGDGFYFVRTQAGFVKAITHFLGHKNTELEVRSYPKSYPSVITLHIDYNGSNYIITRSIHVKKLLNGIKQND